MINLIVLIIVLFSFIIASIEDIKKREVYNYLNYAFAFSILCIAIFDSINTLTITPLKYCGFGFLIGFAIGSLLYYIGVWGGGDAKFLIGFAASTYYLMPYVKTSPTLSNIFFHIQNVISETLNPLFLIIIKLVIIINIIFLIYIIIKLFNSTSKEIKERITLFFILFFLLSGLYLNLKPFYLILLGFISFILIFFADEEIFLSMYINSKKKILELEQTDKINQNIKYGNKIIVDVKEGIFGLSKENISDIKEKFKDSQEQIKIRKTLPYSFLISFNYIIYLLKIISIDELNLSILGFLLKFLFFSFCIGGLIAILLLLLYFLRNTRKVLNQIKISKQESLIMLATTIISLIMSITLNSRFLIILTLILIYLFIKIAKIVEKLMFIKKKNINNISLGDWIVEDIKIGKKTIYTTDDFRLGINEKQLEKIKNISKKYPKYQNLYVKDGLAFIPPLLIGFLIMIFI